MNSDQLNAAALMTTMPPNVPTTNDDPLGIAANGTLESTPAPYVDFSDELLFDPDDLDSPGGTGGFKLPGDAIVPVAPRGNISQTAALPSTTPPPAPEEQPPVTINLLDEDSSKSQEDTSGPFGMSMWQGAIIALALAVCCILALVLFLVVPRASAAPGLVSTGFDGGGAFGGYGGTGF